MNGINETICFFTDLDETLSRLSDADAGALIKAVFASVNGRDAELEAGSVADALFPIVKGQVDRLTEYRKRKSSKSKIEQKSVTVKHNEAKVEQTGANGSKTEQATAPYPIPYPYPTPVPEEDIKENPPTGGKRKGPSFADLFADCPELAQDFVEEAWNDWIEVRKKFPWTDRAAALNANTLKRCAKGDPVRAAKILEAAVEHGWRGLYDLDDNKKPKGGKALDWDSVVV